MLQVPVDYSQIGGRARQHTLDTGGGQASATNSVKTADTVVVLSNLTYVSCGFIRGVVIHEDEFPTIGCQGYSKALDQFEDVLSLIECGHDDGQFGSSADTEVDIFDRSADS